MVKCMHSEENLIFYTPIGLKGNFIVSGDFTKIVFQFLKKFSVAFRLIFRNERMKICQLRIRARLECATHNYKWNTFKYVLIACWKIIKKWKYHHLSSAVELHGARAEGNHTVHEWDIFIFQSLHVSHYVCFWLEPAKGMSSCLFHMYFCLLLTYMSNIRQLLKLPVEHWMCEVITRPS